MRYKVVNTKRFMLSVIVLTLLITVIIGVVSTVRADRDYQLKTVYVENGQSLWTLSKIHNNTDLEIREYIELVCEINNITPDIRPQQAIQMPILK